MSEFLSGVIAALIAIIFKFILDFILNKYSIHITTKKKYNEIVIENRFLLLEKIFISLESAWSMSILKDDICKIEDVLCDISKFKIPRELYFTEKENEKIEMIIDEIKKCTSPSYVDFGKFKSQMRELKKLCLDEN